MKKVILVTLSLLLLVGSVSAYGLYLKCPEQAQVGTPVKCSIDSDFPPGTTFYIMLNQGPTNIMVKSETVMVQEKQQTQYRLLDTTGLPEGQYSINLKFTGADEPRLRSDSVTSQIVKIYGGSTTTTAPITIITTNPTAVPTTVKTMTPITTVPTQAATTVTITTNPTQAPSTMTITTAATTLSTPTVTTAPTKSMESLIAEQNKKIDDQNKLIAEQNQKLSEQNDILSQITSYFKNVFGWK